MFKFGQDVTELNHEISVYDTKGNLVQVVDMPADEEIPMMVCYFADERYVFATSFSAVKAYVTDKEKFLSGNPEWRTIISEE